MNHLEKQLKEANDKGKRILLRFIITANLVLIAALTFMFVKMENLKQRVAAKDAIIARQNLVIDSMQVNAGDWLTEHSEIRP